MSVIGTSPERVEQWRQLIAGEDDNALSGALAEFFGGAHEALLEGLQDVKKQGFRIESEVLFEGEVVGVKHLLNPSAEGVERFATLLGFNAKEQLLTPRSKGKGQKDLSVVDHLAWIRARNGGGG